MIAVLVLSLFPGLGLLDLAFEEAGFTIVRGPDLLWGGDVRRFHPPAGKFDGVIGGPPCQIHSRMRHLNPRAGERHGDLIPEFVRVVSEAGPQWFLMENVPEAPVPSVLGYLIEPRLLRDVWVGGETSRLRRFTFGALERARFEIATLALHRTDPTPAVLAGGGGRSQPVRFGGSGKRKKPRSGPSSGPRATIAELLAAQGLPGDWLDDSPLTVEGQRKGIGNGVPLPMGRAVAAAVKGAIGMLDSHIPKE